MDVDELEIAISIFSDNLSDSIICLHKSSTKVLSAAITTPWWSGPL